MKKTIQSIDNIDILLIGKIPKWPVKTKLSKTTNWLINNIINNVNENDFKEATEKYAIQLFKIHYLNIYKIDINMKIFYEYYNRLNKYLLCDSIKCINIINFIKIFVNINTININFNNDKFDYDMVEYIASITKSDFVSKSNLMDIEIKLRYNALNYDELATFANELHVLLAGTKWMAMVIHSVKKIKLTRQLKKDSIIEVEESIDVNEEEFEVNID